MPVKSALFARRRAAFRARRGVAERERAGRGDLEPGERRFGPPRSASRPIQLVEGRRSQARLDRVEPVDRVGEHEGHRQGTALVGHLEHLDAVSVRRSGDLLLCIVVRSSCSSSPVKGARAGQLASHDGRAQCRGSRWHWRGRAGYPCDAGGGNGFLDAMFGLGRRPSVDVQAGVLGAAKSSGSSGAPKARLVARGRAARRHSLLAEEAIGRADGHLVVRRAVASDEESGEVEGAVQVCRRSGGQLG